MKKQLLLQPIAVLFVLLLIGGTLLSSCKKEKKISPVKATTELKTTIDGVAYNVSESGLSGNIYSDAGDAVKSVELNAALDGSGRKFTFFISDLKNGKIILDPKTGTSMMPHPDRNFMERLETIPGGIMAGTGGVQTYARYDFSGNAYYAYSGFFEITYEPETGKIQMTWSITFKDASGRDFTSAGSFTIYVAALVSKPKSEVKDPTPVSATPTIESITPASGYDNTEVAIVGTNFSATAADNVVKFNGVNATVTSATTTKLVVNAPKLVTTGAITVKVKNSAVTTGPVFTVAQPPTYTGITPATAKAGETITITGTNFDTNIAMDEVQFFTATPGTYVMGVIKSATATTMVVEVPATAATGILNIKVGGRQASRLNTFDGVFTLATAGNPNNPIDIGKRGLVYNIGATASAIDGQGFIYTYDDNQQLTKRKNDGTVVKTLTKNDFYTGFPALNNYKVLAMAPDANGKVHFLLYCPTWPNGEVKVFMGYLDSEDRMTKEFEVAMGTTSFQRMAIDSKGNYFLITNDYANQGIIKIKSDGTYTTYLDGGASGAFSGTGAYDLGFGLNDDLYVLTYTKPANTSAVPANQVIYKFTSDKTRTTVFENKNPGYKDGELGTAQFQDIRCIAVSGLDVYVGDHGNFRIRKIATRTNQVSTVAGNGKQYDPLNGNQPTYIGGLLNVNIFGVRSLQYDNINNALYGGSNQKFVLN